MRFKIPLLSRHETPDLAAPDRPRFPSWPIRRTREVPKVAAIVVRGWNGANLIESHNADESDGTFFGRMTVDAPWGLSQTFSIDNVGTAPLRLGRIGIEGTGADQFEVTGFPGRIVAPGGSTTLTLRYRARRAGSAVALVLIPSNDATERPYLFLVEGYAEAANE